MLSREGSVAVCGDPPKLPSRGDALQSPWPLPSTPWNDGNGLRVQDSDPVVSIWPRAAPTRHPEGWSLTNLFRGSLQVLLLLILSFWVSYYLKVRRIRSIHETIVALFAGMAVGLLVRLAPGNVVQDMISFKSTILLNVLLPPIILNSGYQLKQVRLPA